jgi:hypothetical protein
MHILMSPMKLLREPLLHFLLVGALLFGAYAWLNRGESDAGDLDHTIRITERELAWLVETWTRQWQRQPNERELQGLVTDYLREELLAREARGLELDRDDIIVRRRLAQKMTFILEDTARLAEPEDAELRALYDADRARFDAPARVSIVSVFFSTDKRGDRAAADARAFLGRLSAAGVGSAPRNAGDSSLLPGELLDADEQAISGIFGAEFAKAVMTLAPGAWQGPVESAFGQHLVRVTARKEAEPRPFEAVRGTLVEEWRRQGEAAAKELYFKSLLERYDVVATDSVRPLIDPALATLRGEAK